MQLMFSLCVATILGVANSNQEVDSQQLRAEWKRMEATARSAPLRRAIEVNRGLLTSLDNFRFAVGNQEGHVEDPIASENSVDPFGLEKLWTTRNGPRENAVAAWASATTAAHYAHVPSSDHSVEARVPVRVDVVPVGFSSEGHNGIHLPPKAMHAWLEGLAATVPLESLVASTLKQAHSSPVAFDFEYRLVTVAPTVCTALEKFLQRCLVRSSAGPGNPSSNSPYVLSWRMEALLGDLVGAIDDADHTRKKKWERNSGFDSTQRGGDDDDDEAGGRSSNGEGSGGGPPALTLFLLNPRRTFVSKYRGETYGYQQGLSAPDLMSLLSHNRSLLTEATELEAGSEGSWRKQAARKSSSNSGSRPSRQDRQAAKERVTWPSSKQKAQKSANQAAGIRGSNLDDEDDDDDDRVAAQWEPEELASEADLSYTETILRDVGYQPPTESNGGAGEEASLSSGLAHHRRRVRALDATRATDAWAGAVLALLKEDADAADFEAGTARDGGGDGRGDAEGSGASGASGSMHFAARELADMTSGQAIRWRSASFQANPPSSLPHTQASKDAAAAAVRARESHDTNLKGAMKAAKKAATARSKAEGARRRQLVLRDLLEAARLEARAGGAGSNEGGKGLGWLPPAASCSTDLWVSAPGHAQASDYPGRAALVAPANVWGQAAVEAQAAAASADAQALHGGWRHGAARMAWVDLSAGPFKWGPTVGGKAVRTLESLPEVPKEYKSDRVLHAGLSSPESKGEAASGAMPSLEAESVALEAWAGQRLGRLSALAAQLKCDATKEPGKRPASSDSSNSGGGNSGGGDRDSSGASNDMCSTVSEEIVLLSAFAGAASKLRRYHEDLTTEDKSGSTLETSAKLQRAHVEMLRTVKALIAPLDSVTMGKEAGSGAASVAESLEGSDSVGGPEAQLLDALGSTIESIAHTLLAPPFSHPWLDTPMEPRKSAAVVDQMGAPKKPSLAAAAPTTSVQAALRTSFAEVVVVDLFVVRDHDHFDPLDVASGGLDVSAIREGFLAMTEPLQQEVVFTLHSVRTADDPVLALALAQATTHALRPTLDATTGQLVKRNVACFNSQVLRQGLRHASGSASAATSGSSSSSNSNDAPSPRRHLPIFVFSLAAHEDALLDCDPDSTFPAAPPTSDALLEAAAVGPSNTAPPDLVVALQTPEDFSALSGLSCGSRSGGSPARRRPRDPSRAVLAAAASLLAGVPASVAPHPAPGAVAASTAAVSSSWLLAAAELPRSPIARHSTMAPLAADLTARYQVVKVLEASVVLDRAALAMLNAITPQPSLGSASSPASPSSSQRPKNLLLNVPTGVILSFALHRALGDVRRLLDRTQRRRQAISALVGGWGDFASASPHLNLLLADSRAAYRAAVSATKAATEQRCLDLAPVLLREAQNGPGGRRGPSRRIWGAAFSAVLFLAAALVVALYVLGADMQQQNNSVPYANRPRELGVAETMGLGLREAFGSLQAALKGDSKGKAE